mmetsp:Transcript_14281/g.43399  ORF Transcript_14281/g.43399 Transcript_14281/m.43399 type:complete len:314 (-) Transcript_14281:1138-2079(-)
MGLTIHVQLAGAPNLRLGTCVLERASCRMICICTWRPGAIIFSIHPRAPPAAAQPLVLIAVLQFKAPSRGLTSVLVVCTACSAALRSRVGSLLLGIIRGLRLRGGCSSEARERGLCGRRIWHRRASAVGSEGVAYDGEAPVQRLIDGNDEEVFGKHVHAACPCAQLLVAHEGLGAVRAACGALLEQLLVEERREDVSAGGTVARVAREDFLLEVAHVKVHQRVVQELLAIQALSVGHRHGHRAPRLRIGVDEKGLVGARTGAAPGSLLPRGRWWRGKRLRHCSGCAPMRRLRWPGTASAAYWGDEARLRRREP